MGDRFATLIGDKNGVFNTNAAETGEIRTRLDCHHEASSEDTHRPAGQHRLFVDL
jgi:hypothetical protein